MRNAIFNLLFIVAFAASGLAILMSPVFYKFMGGM